MKIAIVHDFLLKLGGAERVTKLLSEIFPEAPIFTLLYDEEKMKTSDGKYVFSKEKIKTSFLQKYPKFIRRKYRYLIHKMPRAIEELNLNDYDLIISSSNSFAHGVITSLETKHLCYCHSPMRYCWDWSNEYRKENNLKGLKAIISTKIINYLRQWDQIACKRPSTYIANSKNVQNRLKKYYKVNSEVIYPPVDISRFKIGKNHSDYFLIVSTLTPYKKIDLAIHLFNKIGKKLVIIGDGPQRKYLESISGDNIDFLGFKNDIVVKEYMENCRAFIFPGEEDFGITPVEAMACGKPVLAFGKGGVLETIIPEKTGEFFFEQNIEAMEDGLARLIYNEKFYSPHLIRKHSRQFDKKVFIEKIQKTVRELKKYN